MNEEHSALDELVVRIVHPSDSLAAPLLADLEREYDTRYGMEVLGEPAAAELNRYPNEAFIAPNGTFLVLLAGGEVLSGGAFKRYDERTAEFKRIWTRADVRGRGLARRVLAALESEASALGYERVYLTTGPRQPEAVALYLGTGYEPQFDTDRPAAEVGLHAFTKHLVPVHRRTGDPGRTSARDGALVLTKEKAL